MQSQFPDAPAITQYPFEPFNLTPEAHSAKHSTSVIFTVSVPLKVIIYKYVTSSQKLHRELEPTHMSIYYSFEKIMLNLSNVFS